MVCECGGNMGKISLNHESFGIKFWDYVCESCGHLKVTGTIVMKFTDYLLADYEENNYDFRN